MKNLDEELKLALQNGHDELLELLTDSIQVEAKKEELHGEVFKLRENYKRVLLSNLRDTTNFKYAGILLEDFEALNGETFEQYIKRSIVDIENVFGSKLGCLGELKELLRNLKGE